MLVHWIPSKKNSVRATNEFTWNEQVKQERVRMGISTLIVLALGAGIFILILYIFAFVIVFGPQPKGKEYDKFIMDLSAPQGDASFIKTVLTWGYFKRSFREFIKYYKLKFFPVSKATLGKRCPDATLVSLDGTVKSLLKDYVDIDQDIPLILNMGSYT